MKKFLLFRIHVVFLNLIFLIFNYVNLKSNDEFETDILYGFGLLRKKIENPVLPKEKENIPYLFSRYISGIGLGGFDKYEENKVNGICLAGNSELLICNGIQIGFVAGSNRLNGLSFGFISETNEFNGISIGIYSSEINKTYNSNKNNIGINIALISSIIKSNKNTYGMAIGGIYTDTKNYNGLAISSIFNQNENFHGLFLSGLINSSDEFRGIELCAIANISRGEFFGIQIASVNSLYNGRGIKQYPSSGIQLGVLNLSRWEFKGIQFGVVNYSYSISGLQFGLINLSKQLNGIQIGLINYASNSYLFPIMPLLNIHFGLK